MSALRDGLTAIILTLVGALPVSACPLCETQTGERVRAGIFNDEFGYNLLVTALPFPILLGLVALIHFGFPWRKNARTGNPSEGN